jgi:hypothetical protein
MEIRDLGYKLADAGVVRRLGIAADRDDASVYCFAALIGHAGYREHSCLPSW